jgi:hypothetical protein
MLFELPLDLLTIVLGFLSPDAAMNVNALTRIDLLPLFRVGRGYKKDKNENEKDAFERFRQHYFMRHLYHESMRVPRQATHALLDFRPIVNHIDGPALFNMIRIIGANRGGRLVMAVFKHGLVERKETTWPFFLALAVNCKRMQLTGFADLMTVIEEAELALALVQSGKFHQVGELLYGYQPRTVNMLKAMLHFRVEMVLQDIDPLLLTQELCEYWFFMSPVSSQKWLVNHLPASVSIERMLVCNAMRFMSLASKKTILKYGLVADRVLWVQKSATFFPALLSRRKKCGIDIALLAGLSDGHIKLHGRIDHLLATNSIVLRSKLFRPSMEVLEIGAKWRDQFFSLYLDRIPFITRYDKARLRAIVEPSVVRPSPILPGYIFSGEMKVCILSQRELLSGAFQSDVILQTVV